MKQKILSAMIWIIFIVTIVSIHFSLMCRKQTDSSHHENGSPSPPAWSIQKSIYEVNLRQYTQQGTFKAFEKHLPRLKEMGVDILWFMPIHPIGQENRKGSMGSYYSVKDYLAVNPELGKLEDFTNLVDKIHDMSMYVILDWVANHTAWDNRLTVDHPDWFTKDSAGYFQPPVPDWSDVIDLNYDHPELRNYMIEALKFWVVMTDIDGFRCDVAEMVPLDFWKRARSELDGIKPVFMLAEGESPELHNHGFDMTYNWKLFHLMNDVASGKATALDLRSHVERETEIYPDGSYRMVFTTNHDENAWNGTVFERLGDGVETFAVLAATVGGMPLIYSGQEAGLNKRLAFFEKDPIPWRKHELTDLYTTLLHLKKENRALWNGSHGGCTVPVATTHEEAVFAFVREKKDDKVFVVLNLTGDNLSIIIEGAECVGNYREIFTNERSSISQGVALRLKPWEYFVFTKFE